MTAVLARGLGKRNTHPLLVGVQTGRATVAIRAESSRKPKIRASTESGFATPGVYSKDSYPTTEMGSVFFYVYCCSGGKARKCNQTRRPSGDERIRKHGLYAEDAELFDV